MSRHMGCLEILYW